MIEDIEDAKGIIDLSPLVMEVRNMESQPMNEVQKRKAFHRNPRVIAARKDYRAEVLAGIPEHKAWAKANAIFAAVRVGLEGEPTCEDVFGWHFNEVSK